MSTRKAAPGKVREPIVIERRFNAPVEKVWRMWTTREGLEIWWSPEGCEAVVRHLDVRVGGRFEIVMTAVAPPVVAELKRLGLNASNVSKAVYDEIEPNRRIVFTQLLDFVPGVAPYTMTVIVEMSPLPEGGTRLVLTCDGLHNEDFTRHAAQGWNEQLGKLEKVLV